MSVYIPNIDEISEKPHDFEGGIIREENLGVEYNKLKCKKKIKFFKNKTPTFSIYQEALVLNFHGRVKNPSSKNFQIIDGDVYEFRDGTHCNIFLQFGKVKEDEFIADFQYPFCPLQAFAICLSSLDKKLGVI